MSDSPQRTVLIDTRPLGEGNYGGILQAYALQVVLRNWGLQPLTNVVPAGIVQGWRAHAKQGIKHVAVSANLPILGPRWQGEFLRRERDSELDRFVNESVATTSVYLPSGAPDTDLLSRPDAFIVGSDQVWRAAYGRVPSYLFDYLPPSDARPRIAYAASFGTGNLAEYDSSLLAQTRELAVRMTSVSVREASGVDLCREAWGVDATHVLDPTMLLSRDEYVGLTASASDFVKPDSFVTYILDRTRSVDAQIGRMAAKLGQGAADLLPRDASSMAAYRRDRGRYQRASVEQWVRAIGRARFFVTDSFHGTVFAILNNTPFLTIANHNRGAERFVSLLGTLGLGHRLVDATSPVTDVALMEPVDWRSVNRVLERERAISRDFLATALGDLAPISLGPTGD